jgi:hypothetical protein
MLNRFSFFFPFGLGAALATFVGGKCTVHINLYRRPRHAYEAEAEVKDSRRYTVATHGRVDLHKQYAIRGHMPHALLMSGGNDGTMHFAYGAQTWDQSYRNCRVGGWDKNKRQMHCDFAC